MHIRKPTQVLCETLRKASLWLKTFVVQRVLGVAPAGFEPATHGLGNPVVCEEDEDEDEEL